MIFAEQCVFLRTKLLFTQVQLAKKLGGGFCCDYCKMENKE